MNWKNLFQTKSVDLIIQDANISDIASNSPQLKKTLTVVDLTAFGVAALIGAGIFSTIGNAAFEGGPAVVLLFIFTAIACAFSALCYAEFASALPISGSAYTYAYASFGEIIAWIIGWDLLMEYAISNIVVAISWSQYFTGLLGTYGIRIPPFLTMDYFSASKGFKHVENLLVQGQTLSQLSHDVTPSVLKGYFAWNEAIEFFGFPLICDLPAVLITFVITFIVFLGIEESKKTSNFLVFFKVAVVLTVISIGAFYVRPENWIPFAPSGVGGVMKGISAVFFAYIGFDAISSTAEECKNPQRDLPRGMIYALIICTLIYTFVALILTGMVSYKKLGVADPLAYVFGPEGVHIPWIARLIDISAVIALSTVLLVYQLGQPRIWMAMSRDGLLPPIFSAIHKTRRIPWFSTLLTGLFVAIPTFFMNQSEVTDLTSIGTLFAFILVCGGILKLNPLGKNLSHSSQKFVTPYINSKYIFPSLLVLFFGLTFYFYPEKFSSGFSHDRTEPSIFEWMSSGIPNIAFIFSMIYLAYLCFKRSYSLIPVLGLATCSYLLSELGFTNWLRFICWLILGLSIYFLYGMKHSKLRKKLEFKN